MVAVFVVVVVVGTAGCALDIVEDIAVVAPEAA